MFQVTVFGWGGGLDCGAPLVLRIQAAPMDKDEIEDLIKKCFEADNNGEINFLSFWAGQCPIRVPLENCGCRFYRVINLQRPTRLAMETEVFRGSVHQNRCLFVRYALDALSAVPGFMPRARQCECACQEWRTYWNC